MSFCVRVGLDLAPESGAEAALVARLLKLSRDKGYVYHFFATRRAVAQLFVLPGVLYGEGHALGVWCKDKWSLERVEPSGQGVAVEWAWMGPVPEGAPFVVAPDSVGPQVYGCRPLAGSDPDATSGAAVLAVDVTELASSDPLLEALEADIDRWLAARRAMVTLPS